MDRNDLSKYEGQYNDDSLERKISRFAKKAGLTTIYHVLLLYHILKSESTSAATIIGALGYFICPLDIIPDIIIGTGYIDDCAALVLALNCIASSITQDIKKKAKNKLHDIFDDFDDSEINSKYL